MMLVQTLGKSTPWRDDQRPTTAFGYEDRQFHAGLEREYPGDHNTHSENDEDELS